jgi:hypothetical protein
MSFGIIKKLFQFFKKSEWHYPKILTIHYRVIFRFFRLKWQKNFNSTVSFVLRYWLIFKNRTFSFLYKNKNKIMTVFLIVVFGFLVFCIQKYYTTICMVYNNIRDYLIFQNDSKNGVVSFSGFFTAIGASILGVLAITFSLSLFALQQAADKHTPNVLSIFLKDKTNLCIFWSVAFVAVVFFAMAILPLSNYLFLELIVGLILLFVVFFLLRKQYFYIVKFINPNYQIILQHNDAIKSLDKVDRWLNLMIKIGAIRHGESNENK